MRLLGRVDEAQASVRPAAGAWCIKEVVAHMARREGQFQTAYERIVAQDDPVEPEFGLDEPAHALGRNLNAHIQAFSDARARSAAFLGGLTQPQWLRTCRHASLGRIKLRGMVEVQIGHDNEHLAQIVNIREFLETQT
jgi:hypothetical protein